MGNKENNMGKQERNDLHNTGEEVDIPAAIARGFRIARGNAPTEETKKHLIRRYLAHRRRLLQQGENEKLEQLQQGENEKLEQEEKEKLDLGEQEIDQILDDI